MPCMAVYNTPPEMNFRDDFLQGGAQTTTTAAFGRSLRDMSIGASLGGRSLPAVEEIHIEICLRVFLTVGYSI